MKAIVKVLLAVIRIPVCIGIVLLILACIGSVAAQQQNQKSHIRYFPTYSLKGYFTDAVRFYSNGDFYCPTSTGDLPCQAYWVSFEEIFVIMRDEKENIIRVDRIKSGVVQTVYPKISFAPR